MTAEEVGNEEKTLLVKLENELLDKYGQVVGGKDLQKALKLSGSDEH